MGRLKPLEKKFKAFCFSVAKSFLRVSKGDFTALNGNKLKKVLFLRPEKIGDMVISFPVFDGLKKQFPHLKIAILGSPRNYAIIKNDPRFDTIYLYKKSLTDISTFRQIRNDSYDCVVDMIGDDSVTALFMSQLAAPGKPRIGVGKEKFQEYYDYNYAYRTNNRNHVIDNTLKLLDAFAIDSSRISGYAPPYLTEAERTKADSIISALKNQTKTETVIGYNLSAGASSRLWPHEKTLTLLQKIINEYPSLAVLIFSMPEERAQAEELKKKISTRVTIVPPGLSLTESSAVIEKLALFITPDTSLVHIARSLSVPVVGLYSRFMSNFILWRPYGQDDGAVVSNCDGNIFDIEPDQVYTAFRKVYANRKVAAE